MATDGNSAVILCEREASDAAGAYPITPSTQMGEYWAEEAANGHLNTSNRPLIFIEPESEHAAAAVTAGMSMTGLRATNFTSAQGAAFMHESLYAAVGKRLPYVLNIGCRAITKASLNVHCGHDDYHCIDDTGFIQLMASSAQEAADLNLIGRKVAEYSLTPAAVAQDGFLTTHLIEPLLAPERELIDEFLGHPDDMIECPTPAQKMLYGEHRRRVPELWNVDNPMSSGTVQNQDAYMQSVVAQRPYFFDHITALTDQFMAQYYELTGRQYSRVGDYKVKDAEYIIVGQGSMTVQAQAVADYLRKTRKLRVGVINLTQFRPFPGDLLGQLLQGCKALVVLERTDQPLAEDLPIMREVRATLSKCLENGLTTTTDKPFPGYACIAAKNMPSLYSGAYGLGSRDLQPEGLIAAIENMLPDGKQRRFFYLSVDFIRVARNPQEEIRLQNILDAYPGITDLALRGSENPNLLPEGAITVRMHSVGGWGAITTGKNLAMTLYDLLGYDIKANPKYGSEKKGQPTTYYLSAAPEPIRLNCEYHYVDVVLAPDPNVFSHSNALNGLIKGGTFIIQSTLDSQAAVWESFPATVRKTIVDNEIRVFYIDGFKIAREEASNPELEFRLQGNAFQGAFFAGSPVCERSGLSEKALFDAITGQLRAKFGSKGETIVEDNLRVVRRGFDEIQEITEKPLNVSVVRKLLSNRGLPFSLKKMPEGDGGVADIHTFWERTGSFYHHGEGDNNLADPFMAASIMPAATGIYRDMTQIRFEYPRFITENCTACGDCYSICPDSAIPGLVNTIADVFTTVIERIERQGRPTLHLRRAVRTVEKKLRELIDLQGEQAVVSTLIDEATLKMLSESELSGDARANLEEEAGLLLQHLNGFEFSITKPYYLNREKKTKGSGGLFSITINPFTCKGCMECVEVCDDKALVAEAQTDEAVVKLRHDWEFWLDLPTTDPGFIRIDDLDEKIGALETLMLDKRSYSSMVSGDGACLGCGEKTTIHLFTATATALMQPRVKKLLVDLDDLINRLETHVRLRLAQGLDLSNRDSIQETIDNAHEGNFTLSTLTSGLEKENAEPLDSEWLQWVTGLLDSLRDLKSRYFSDHGKTGRADLGLVNSTGCTSVWGSTFPYNPYPFPWTNHLFQDSPSMAMGIFEGHMAKMADGFKAIRKTRLELDDKYNATEHEDFFRHFNWKDFSDEEWHLCPPVVSVGGDGAMYDIGFQNLSRALMSGIPIKVLILDTQVYSNTGGQSCTSGFISQVADMAPYGKTMQGKQEIRKEMSLIAMAHRSAFVLQGSFSHTTHLLEGFIDGLNSRRPALFNIYAVCQPEHGVADDVAEVQSRLAVESRAYPLFRFDPDIGDTLEECSTLEGNPLVQEDWTRYKLNYIEDGKQKQLDLPLTFADFAFSEGRFRKNFRPAPRRAWNDDMIPLAEFIELEEDEQEGRFPYIWGVNSNKELTRVLVSQAMLRSTLERRQFWHQLQSLCTAPEQADTQALRDQIKLDLAQNLATTLLGLSNGNANSLLNGITSGTASAAEHFGSNGNGAAADDYEPVWIDTPECTTCDECTEINPGMFAYNDNQQAVVINSKAGSFLGIVKAAEKCTAGCLHPGTPFNPDEKNLEKLVKRAEKYQ